MHFVLFINAIKPKSGSQIATHLIATCAHSARARGLKDQYFATQAIAPYWGHTRKIARLHKGKQQMASYIDGTLIKDERVTYIGHISLWSLAPLIALGFVTLPLFGLGLIFWGMAYIRYKTTELAFTNKRVIAKFGFISRQTIEINMSKIESIQVNQSILGRIFNFGKLIISGAGTPQAPIPGISNPMEFRRAFMESQDQAAQARQT